MIKTNTYNTPQWKCLSLHPPLSRSSVFTQCLLIFEPFLVPSFLLYLSGKGPLRMSISLNLSLYISLSLGVSPFFPGYYLICPISGEKRRRKWRLVSVLGWPFINRWAGFKILKGSNHKSYNRLPVNSKWTLEDEKRSHSIADWEGVRWSCFPFLLFITICRV